MGKQHQVSFRQYVEEDFTCQRCKTLGRARFLAKGTGAWAREGLFGDASSAQEQSAQSAATAMSRDAEIVKSYLKCPGCHQRNPGAFTFTYLGVVACVGLAVGLFLAGGAGTAPMVALGLVAVALYIAARAWGRIRRADVAAFSMVEKGDATVDKAPKRAPLPRATLAAGTAPKVAAAPAPVIPLRTSAPEIAAPRDAGDGPAFLK